MRKLLAELLLAALPTSTQYWQKQEDALAASLVFKDSGLFCDSNYDLGSL